MANKGNRKRISKLRVLLVRARDKDICQICFVLVVEGDGSIDHIERVADGGTNEIANLRWSHKKCNNERHYSADKAKANKARRAQRKKNKKLRGRPNPRNSGGADPYRCLHCNEWPSQGHKGDCPYNVHQTFEEKLAAQKQDEDYLLEKK